MDKPLETDQGHTSENHCSQDLLVQFFENAPHGFFLAERTNDGTFGFPLSNPIAKKLLTESRHAGESYAHGLKKSFELITNQHLAEPIEREDSLLIDNRELKVKTLLNRILAKDGTTTRILGIIDDVSLQKSREYMQALREVEFRLVAERLNTGVARYDQECRRIYVNPYAAQALQMAPESMIGTRPSELPGGEIGEMYESQIRKVIQSGEYTEYCQHLTMNNESRWCRLMLFPEWEPDGQVGSVLVIGQDYEDRRSQQRLLQYGTDDFEANASRSSNVILCFNGAGECNYMNESADELFRQLGETPHTLPNTSKRLHPLVSSMRESVRHVMATESPLENELSWSAADGRQFHYRLRYLPRHALLGESISVLVTARAITPQQAALPEIDNNSLIVHREKAREAERSRLAQELHDELGQLLTALRFRLTLLRPSLGTGESGRALQEAMEIVERASREVQRITRSAKPLQLDAGLTTAIEDLVGDFTASCGIQVDLDLDKKPEIDNNDATLVFRIVQESLTNIARHADAHSAKISLHRGESHYHLKITDNGKGFDLSAPKRRSLGLAGMRERVMLLRGEIVFQSTPGQGTTIRIDIPVKK